MVDASGSASKTFILYPFDTNAGNGARIWFNGTSLINENGVDRDDGNYHHFVFVSHSSTSHALYVDGELIGTSSTSKSIHADTNQFHMGRWKTGNQHFNGSLDDIRIYDNALSSHDIKTLYFFGQ